MSTLATRYRAAQLDKELVSNKIIAISMQVTRLMSELAHDSANNLDVLQDLERASDALEAALQTL